MNFRPARSAVLDIAAENRRIGGVKRFVPNQSMRLLAFALLAFLPLAVQAHPAPVEAEGLLSGMSHPVMGLDHLLAALAVGCLAVQMGGRAFWLLPVTFVSCLLVGMIAGMGFFSTPVIEAVILSSVLVLGGMLVSPRQPPLWAGVLIVGFFALFHGHAHGSEMPVGAARHLYTFGFLITTGLLHWMAMGSVIVARHYGKTSLVRYAGAAMVCAGVALWIV